MYIVTASLVCDFCDEVFEQAVAKSWKSNPDERSLTAELDEAAHVAGWYRGHEDYICNSCEISRSAEDLFKPKVEGTDF